MKFSSCGVFAAFLLAALAVRAQQNIPGLDVNIRSAIDWGEKDKRDANATYAKAPVRARRYFLARVSEDRATGINMERPIDPKALAGQVSHQLVARGFRSVQPGEKPDIIVTVKYGRGYVGALVPYTNTDDDPWRGGLSDSDPIAPWPMRERFVGMEERNQRLFSYDKLFIQVRAWEYPPPPDPKKKTKLLWMTTMFVDDPDHRDLNLISEQMLAKGALYFDRHINRDDEVILNTVSGFRGNGPHPDAHVEVGTPEVVHPDAKK